MIKRLKWNVLYAESAEEDSESSDSSAQSTERGSAHAQALLDQLARNDRSFASTLDLEPQASSSDEEDTLQEPVHSPAAPVEHHVSSESDRASYAEWRECELCPGKRFLNDREVDAHLASKRHARALKRFEARSIGRANQKPTSTNIVHLDVQSFPKLESFAEQEHLQSSLSLGLTEEKEAVTSSPRSIGTTQSPAPPKLEELGNADTPSVTAERENAGEQQRRANKRKAVVKRRLRALKRRKWEKAAKKEIDSKAAKGEEKDQIVCRLESEERQRLDSKLGDLEKTRDCRERRNTNQRGVQSKDKEGNANEQVDPSLQRRERTKRKKRSVNPTVCASGTEGEAKRKKLKKASTKAADDRVMRKPHR